MPGLIRLFAVALLAIAFSTTYSQTIATGSFTRVVISPYIEATFIKAKKAQVVINSSLVDEKKLHVETRNGTLRMYLEGAKELPRNPRSENRTREPLYPNHAVTATIYYNHLDALSLRGKERFTVAGPLSAQHFTLKLYGECALTFEQVNFGELQTAIYGESSVEMKSGSIDKQS